MREFEAEELKSYLESVNEPPLLLDVRQPWEYEEDHIPGAKLVPLGDLKDGTQSLDPEKPILVYCAVGGRSRVAAQLLSGRGFQEVYNVSGGIKAYRGAKATGPQELNLEMIREDESVEEILKLAFGMERALQTFYEVCRDRSQDKELLDLFGKLEHIEEVLSVSDLFIMPSEKESFGLAALEAKACEVPVISSNTGGLPELNQHGITGFLSDVGDVEDMTKNALFVLQDENLPRFKEAALKRAEDFNIEKVLPLYENYYE